MTMSEVSAHVHKNSQFLLAGCYGHSIWSSLTAARMLVLRESCRKPKETGIVR